VDLKTVHRFQSLAVQRAAAHHRQSVQHVNVEGGQWDEAHSKLRPTQVEWVHTAAALIAQVVARARQLPGFLTNGWKAYTAALLQVVGGVYRPRRRGKVGRQPKPRLVAPPSLFYA